MKPTKHLSLTMIALLACFLLVGCDSEPGEYNSLLYPEVDETVGRAPIGYPSGTADEVIIADARKHLDSVVENGVDERLYSFVYFNELIPLEQFEEYIAKYDLQGKESQSSIAVVVAGDTVMGRSLPNPTISFSDLQSRVMEDISTLPEYVREKAGEPMFTSFAVWATPQQMQKLWDEDPKVRMIGLGGKKGNLMGGWRIRLPGRSFR